MYKERSLNGVKEYQLEKVSFLLDFISERRLQEVTVSFVYEK